MSFESWVIRFNSIDKIFEAYNELDKNFKIQLRSKGSGGYEFIRQISDTDFLMYNRINGIHSIMRFDRSALKFVELEHDNKHGYRKKKINITSDLLLKREPYDGRYKMVGIRKSHIHTRAGKILYTIDGNAFQWNEIHILSIYKSVMGIYNVTDKNNIFLEKEIKIGYDKHFIVANERLFIDHNELTYKDGKFIAIPNPKYQMNYNFILKPSEKLIGKLVAILNIYLLLDLCKIITMYTLS